LITKFNLYLIQTAVRCTKRY